jgi:voltage-gated potassium channel
MDSATHALDRDAKPSHRLNLAAVRRRTFEILERAQPDDGASRVCDVVLILLITLNVTAVTLESVPGLTAPYQVWFDAFELFSVSVFTVEYGLRVWSSVAGGTATARRPVVARIRYMLTPMALLDLIAILPLFLGVFGPVDLRFVRVLRLIRLFKLTRYSASMALLLDVLKDEAKTIGAALFILMLLLVLTASLAYLAEHAVQPDKFGSIPQAMWWAVITMTTVGYGDVTPITPAGKVLGAVIGIIGIGMVAVPAGLLASGFTEEMHSRTGGHRVLPPAGPGQGGRLTEVCAELGLGEDAAARILRAAVDREASQTFRHGGQRR